MARAWLGHRALAALTALAAAVVALGACTRYDPDHSAFIRDRLTGSDAELMVATTQEALEINIAGATAHWGNPETGHFGAVTPLAEETRAGRACRVFEQTATVRGRTGIARRTACRDAGGAWRLAGSDAPAGRVTRWELPPPSEEGYELPDYVRGPGYFSGYPYFTGAARARGPGR